MTLRWRSFVSDVMDSGLGRLNVVFAGREGLLFPSN